MKLQIDVDGLPETKRFLKKKKSNTKFRTNAGVRDATFFIQGEVKSSIAGRRAEKTSVDTGRFLNSVDIRLLKNNGIIFTNLPYSKYLEFGTSRIGARRHFNNTADRNKNNVRKIINKQIKRV